MWYTVLYTSLVGNQVSIILMGYATRERYICIWFVLGMEDGDVIAIGHINKSVFMVI